MFWSFDKFLTFDVLIFDFWRSDFCSSDPFPNNSFEFRGIFADYPRNLG